MKIGVNLFPLRPQIAGGLESFTRNLLKAMFEQNSDHTYTLITAPWNHEEIDFWPGPYRKIRIETGPPLGMLRRLRARLRNSHWDLYRCAMDLGVDVWFCPMMQLDPRHIDIPSVVLVPDIQQEFYPQFFTPQELSHRQLNVKPSCQLADSVITISEYSRTTLLDQYDLDPDKVHVVYGAAGQEFDLSTAEESWSRVKKKYGLQEGYLFYPANTWSHKNHEILLMALHRLKKRGLTPQLVLTGAAIRPIDPLKTLARQLDCEDQIFYLGYVDQRFFPGLYRGAACLVFPSLFEGFGIPLVEAMATGCPIACGEVCSIPEVVGEAAVMFDPRNPDSITDAVETILRDPEVGKELAEKGRSRATLFSWEKAASKALKILEAAHQAAQKRQPRRYVPPQEPLEGHFSDGWAGPRLLVRRVELSRWRNLVLEGEASEHCLPLELRIYGDGDHIDELRLEKPGQFSRTAKLPAAGSDSGLVDIEILASSHFVPTDIGATKDSRHLCFRLHHLALTGPGGNPMTLYKSDQ